MTAGVSDQWDVEFEGVDAGLIASLEKIEAGFITLRDQAKGFGADAKAASAQAEGLGKVTAVASAAGGSFARNWKTIGLSVIGVALGVARLVGAARTLIKVKDRLLQGSNKLTNAKGGLKDTAKATEESAKATDKNTKEIKENTKAVERNNVQLIAAKKNWLDYAMAAMTAYRTYRLFRDAMANRKAMKDAAASTGGLTSRVAGLSLGLGGVTASAGAAFAAVTKFGGSEKAVKGVSREFDKARGTLQATLRASGAFDVVLKMVSDGFKDASKWISDNSVQLQQWAIKGVRVALQGTEKMLQGFLWLTNGAKNFKGYWELSVAGVQWGFSLMAKAGVGYAEQMERMFNGVIEKVRGTVDTLFSGARAALELAPDALGLVDKLDAAQGRFNNLLGGGASLIRMHVGQARVWADALGAEAERGVKGAMGAVKRAEEEHEANVKALSARFAKAYQGLDAAATKVSKVKVQGTKKPGTTDPKEQAHLTRVLELETKIAAAEEQRRYADRGALEAELNLLNASREIEKLGKARATLAQRQAILAKSEAEAAQLLNAGRDQQLEREISIAQARERVVEAQWHLNQLGQAGVEQASEARAIERERRQILRATMEDHEREAALAELAVRQGQLNLATKRASQDAARALLNIAEKAAFIGKANTEFAQKLQELEARRRDLAAATMSDQERTVALAQLELEKRQAINDEEQRQSGIRKERVARTIQEVTSMGGGLMSLTNALLDNDIARLKTISDQAEQAAAAEGATKAQRDAAVKAAKDVEAAEKKKEKAAKAWSFLQGLIQAAQAAKATAEGIMGNPAAFLAAAGYASASAQFFVAASASSGGGGGGGGGGAGGGGSASSSPATTFSDADRRAQQAEASRSIAEAIVEANTRDAERNLTVILNNPTMLGSAPETTRSLTDLLVPQLRSALMETRK